ncbi:hypothetical protein ANACOL_03944 [Anaerotruncus colihominis DSM 17241]|uniref:Uncharacterized protein n=1 Tax=Anaerotruncus colihominis DSM 17241 TaxID=445972 RepID=B0PGS6_9FIRM|nr:hypothetical protein ANACOL_03944 [Anaerotruncus colihominis DSM 17241]
MLSAAKAARAKKQRRAAAAGRVQRHAGSSVLYRCSHAFLQIKYVSSMIAYSPCDYKSSPYAKMIQRQKPQKRITQRRFGKALTIFIVNI